MAEVHERDGALDGRRNVALVQGDSQQLVFALRGRPVEEQAYIVFGIRHGGFVAEGGLLVSGDISQSEGAATQLGRELTLAADADSKLKLAYTEQQDEVEISITADGKNYIRAMGIYPDGTVDVPIPAPSIGEDLSLNGNLKLNTRGKGVYSLSTALLRADKDGAIQLGSTESGEDAQRMELAASDNIAMQTIQPGSGWTDALTLDGRQIAAHRNLHVEQPYTVTAAGDVHVGGKLRVDGEFALQSLGLAGTLSAAGQTTLGNLLVQSPDDKAAVFKSGLQLDGGLSLTRGSIELSTTSSGVTASGRQLLYLDAAGTGWLGSTDKSKAPATLQISARDSVRIKSPLVLEEAVSPKDYTIKADVGFESAINGASGNRFCARYLGSGTQNTVGLYTRTGGTEYAVANIAGSGGDVSVIKPLSVPSLEIRGTDIVSAGGSALKLCNSTGVYIRDRYNSSFADVTAAGFISGGYKMASGYEGLDITKGNHLALRIRQSDGTVALPMTQSSTGAANVYMSAGKILYMVGSSRRFKDNIADARADEILPSLRKLPVSTYTSTCAADDQTRVQIGGIAEEFYKVDQRFAIPARDAQGGIQRSGGECVMENIDERALLYSLLLGWQQQDEQIRELKRQLKQMAA